MNKRKKLFLIGFIITFALLTAACSKKSYDAVDTAMTDSSSYNMATGTNGVAYDSNEAAPAAAFGENKDKADGLSSTSALTSGAAAIQPQDKIIRTFNLEVETQEFDSLITKIDSEVNRLGGYVESSQINGKRYYYTEDARYGNIIVRIPSDKVDEFVNTVNDNANIVNKQESTSNVSLQYIEAESRIETLKIEQERLFAILDKEINLDNIITLESRLSDIRYELQNYESQIRYYDNQVAYSTVTMSVQEVEKLTPVTQVKQTVGTRIKNGFSDTMYKISNGLKDFFVWFVVNLPYLLIWAIIIGAIVFITRRSLRKSKGKKNTQSPVMYYGPQNSGQPVQNQQIQNQPFQNQQYQGQQNQNQQNQNQQSQNQQDQNRQN